jgi:hypothetical protein
MPEVIDIAGGDREAVTSGGGGEQSVDHGDFPASLFSAGLRLGPRVHFLLAEGQQASGGEGGPEIGIQPTVQLPSSFSRGQQQDTFSDFRDRNDRHKKLVSGARLQSTGDPRA